MDDKNQIVLGHYAVFHGNRNKHAVYDSYTVTFVEQPSFDYLTICEVI